MSTSKATAIAHPNVALVKYWGKRDERLVLPHQSSLSLTLAPLEIKATIEFGASADEVEINGEEAPGDQRDRVLSTLQGIRAAAAAPLGPARVATRGNFPAAAGLASSAAAFAAIAVAGRQAAGLLPSVREGSIAARLGSGSASRSIQGGFCVWHRGHNREGTDSFAEQVFDGEHWPELRLLAAIFRGDPKEVSSRDGMKRTVATSPFYAAWVSDAEAEVARAVDRIRSRDLEGLGAIAERSAWRMHATCLAADPPLCYLRPPTVELALLLQRERGKGVPLWFTLDAGPNPFILTDLAHEEEAAELALAAGAREVIRCVPGGNARLTGDPLF